MDPRWGIRNSIGTRPILDHVISFEVRMAEPRQPDTGGESAAGFFAEWELERVNFCEELETGNDRPGAYRYFKIHEPK